MLACAFVGSWLELSWLERAAHGADAGASPTQAPQAAATPPKLIGELDVPYPDGAHGDAVVRVTVTIRADGSVAAVEPESGAEPFVSVARTRIEALSFEPALRGGHPVAAKIRLEIVFREPAAEPPPQVEAEPPPNTAPAAPNAEAKPAPAPAPAGVIVEGERPEPSRTATLTRAEVRELPGAFGDPFRALEALPGVTPIVSGLPFFFVRGAPPGNVGYFLDGVRLPLLYHVGIGPAVVHPGLIERVDLYPGGYPARFGRFAGGIVSGETAPPRGTMHGEYSLRAYDVGALVEVPFAEGRGAALVGGRYSYTAFLLSRVSPDVALDYWDYQVRIGYDVTPRDRVTAFAFGSYDYLGQKAQGRTLTVFGTEFHRGDLRYDRILAGGGLLRTAFTLGVDRSRTQQDRFVRSRLAGARNELLLPLGKGARLRAGTDLELVTYDIELGVADLSPAATRLSTLFPARTDLALGLRGDVVWQVTPRFEVIPGVRVDLFGSDGAMAVGVDPRLATRTKLTKRATLLAALGIAHQPPAFVIPVPGFQPGGLRGGLQYAMQESLGVELDLGQATTATATVFQNGFFNMSDPLGTAEREVDGCPPGSFPSGSLAGDTGRPLLNTPDCGPRFRAGTLGPDFSGGGGEAAQGQGGQRAQQAFEVRTLGAAYGLELYLKRQLTSRIGGFLSYTLSRSTRSYGRRDYVATFDRTHVVNAALAYALGRGWRVGTRVVFYTGLPQAANSESETGEAASSRSSAGRLPPFFRGDVRIEKRWSLGREAWFSLVAEWMNATLSKEAVSTTCTLSGCEYQEIGPVTIPSLGLEGGF